MSPANKPGKTPAVIFIHGILSSEACWDELIGLLKTDARFDGRFTFERFQYDTAAFRVDPTLRIPRLKEIGRALATFVESSQFLGREITLVGHSQGGLIILSYLADAVASGRAQTLAAIRQVILIATPMQGSTFIGRTRRAFFSVFRNAQEEDLRVDNPNISDIMGHINGQVVAAAIPNDHAYPVPIRVFYGESDAVVSEASARGGFAEATPLPGDHSAVIRPTDSQSRGYAAISEALLEPVGHRNVFEIDAYEIDLTVEPRPRGSYGFSYSNGQERLVECDNWAKLVQSVTFSRNNRCQSQYEFRYVTKQNGLIEVTTSYTDEAPGDEQAAYERTGQSMRSQFTPVAGKTFACTMAIYKGFDSGHEHIARRLSRQAYYKHIHVRLDLKRFLDDGFVVSQRPQISIDTKYDTSASPHHFGPTVDGVFENGVWTWELENLREGVVRLTWRVDESAGAVASAFKTEVQRSDSVDQQATAGLSAQPDARDQSALVRWYESIPQLEDHCWAAGRLRPNPCVKSLPEDIRHLIRTHVEERRALRAPLDRVDRDVMLIKAKNSAGEPFLLHYFSGKPRIGWKTWLLPSIKREESTVEAQLRANTGHLAGFLRIPSDGIDVSYAPDSVFTTSVKTNRYASDRSQRHVPRLYVFRYCFVTIASPIEAMMRRQRTVPIDPAEGSELEFKWIHVEVMGKDERMWNANGDVILSLQHAFPTIMASVPFSTATLIEE